ncbi:hypothetical protein ACFE04_001297 [Oxalis oulophora]
MAAKMIVGLVVVWMLVAVATTSTEASVSCSTVASDLSPCYSYLANGGTPSSSCCSNIKSLYGSATTNADLQSLCTCLKQLYSSYGSSINLTYVEDVASKCDVDVPYKISPSTDCSSV